MTEDESNSRCSDSGGTGDAGALEIVAGAEALGSDTVSSGGSCDMPLADTGSGNNARLSERLRRKRRRRASMKNRALVAVEVVGGMVVVVVEGQQHIDCGTTDSKFTCIAHAGA